MQEFFYEVDSPGFVHYQESARAWHACALRGEISSLKLMHAETCPLSKPPLLHVPYMVAKGPSSFADEGILLFCCLLCFWHQDDGDCTLEHISRSTAQLV